MWVRGLKPHIACRWFLSLYVAPYVGAWIETRVAAATARSNRQSHPMWVRGLKLYIT